MSIPSSTRTRLTTRPSGPVWCVTSRMPRMREAASRASAGPCASLTPPPFPLPPAWICALTTTVPPPRSCAIRSASSGVKATPPRGTGTPYFLRISFAWYS